VESFRWIAVAISMILGIGVTRLLSSAVMIVRNRAEFVFDVVPAAWATFIFIAQIQFWWAIIELAKIKSVWTLPNFLTLLSMPLLLFIAAALVLPHEARERDLDLRRAFARDGRLALVALALFNAVACAVDVAWWSANLRTITGVMTCGLTVLPLVFLFTERRRLQLAMTMGYAISLIVSEIANSPSAYG
jgi:hypothetical protein